MELGPARPVMIPVVQQVVQQVYGDMREANIQ
jgi:hypothetical protein